MIEFIAIIFATVITYKIVKKDIKKMEKEHKNFKKYNKKTKYINATEVAKHYLISAIELNKIFEDMKLIERKDRWIVATELGKKYGAKENYDTKRAVKYIVWEEKILNKIEIQNAVNKYKNSEIEKEQNLYETTKKQKMTQQEKEEKGKAYEEYIANFFREQGYYVWEHGKEKGRKDKSIDLLVKKEKYIYFVQCKNWENWKIDHKEVKATRTDIREYLEEKKELWQLIKDYQSKILYVTPKACLTKAAYAYIKENNEIVEHQIIPMN